MGRRLTSEESRSRVLAVLERKGYSLVEEFEYIGSSATFIKVQCNKKHDPYFVRYYNLVNLNTGCPRCAKGAISRHRFKTITMKR